MEGRMRVTVFYAHKANAEYALAGAATALIAYLEPRLAKRLGPCTVAVAYGRDDYQNYFHGDWDRWAKEIPERRHAMTGKRLYDLFVCPDMNVGRATAGIIQACLAKGRSVFHFDTETLKLKKVTACECVDDNDWAGGYQLITHASKEA